MSSQRVSERTNELLERLEQAFLPVGRWSAHQLETNNVSGAYQSSGYAAVMEVLCKAHAQEMGWTEPFSKAQRRTLLHMAFDEMGVDRSNSVVTRARWAMARYPEVLQVLKEERLRHKQTERRMRRRARQMGATVGRVDRAAIIARDHSTCYLCGKLCKLEEIHLDHVVPLARNGEHSAENLRVACSQCNIRKGVSMLSSERAML